MFNKFGVQECTNSPVFYMCIGYKVVLQTLVKLVPHYNDAQNSLYCTAYNVVQHSLKM